MKKILLILLCLPLLFSSCKTKVDKENIVVKKNTLSEKNIKEKVKKITEKSFYVSTKFGEPIKDSVQFTNIYLFDENGFQTQLETINSLSYRKKMNYEEYEKHIFKYDTNKNCVLVQVYSIDNYLIRHEENKYDKENNKIEINFYSLNKLQAKHKMEYKYNKCRKIDRYNQEGILKYRSEFIYDKKGRCVEDKCTIYGNVAKNSQINWKLIYDNNDNIIERNVYGENEWNYTTKSIFEYDNKGNWITETTFNNSKWDKRDKSNIISGYFEREIEYYK